MTQKTERAAPCQGRPERYAIQIDGEPIEYTPPTPRIARLILRSIISDERHFQGLEVVHG